MNQAENCHNCVFSRWNPGQWMASLSSGFPRGPRAPISRITPATAGVPAGAGVPELSGPAADAQGRDGQDDPRGRRALRLRGRRGLRVAQSVDLDPAQRICGAIREATSRSTCTARSSSRPKGKVVDHKNRNKLDDTRENLRVCTHEENARNRSKPRGSASRFLGVGYDRHRRKWYANLGVEGKAIWLGYFEDEIEAARATITRRSSWPASSPNLNFPEEWPPERIREVYAKGPAKKNGERSTSESLALEEDRGQQESRAGRPCYEGRRQGAKWAKGGKKTHMLTKRKKAKACAACS